jgi:hypothetical protein
MRTAVAQLHAAASAHHLAVQAADRLSCTRGALAASTDTLQLAAVRVAPSVRRLLSRVLLHVVA